MAHEKRKSIFVEATKGGVGKSVSSYNLAYSLAKLGKKVLAVDFDSQANMSTCFEVEDTTEGGCKKFCVYGILNSSDKSSICKILLSIL